MMMIYYKKHMDNMEFYIKIDKYVDYVDRNYIIYMISN
jgi:hypothetical protein